MRTGRPDLLAVDHVVVAVSLGARLQRREVGSRARFGVSLAPRDSAARDPRQVFALLFLGAVNDKRRTDHADAEHALTVRSPAIGKLL